jgi:hypothetical protein
MATTKSSNGRVDMTLLGISDMELLAIVDDLADEDGWTRTIDVRLQLGESLDKGYRSGVGPRFAWMVRYGWLERDAATSKRKSNERRYRLTAVGQTLLENPKLAAAFSRRLQTLNPAQRISVTRELAENAKDTAFEVRTALRRQWQRSWRSGR